MNAQTSTAIWIGRITFMTLTMFAIILAKLPLGLSANAPIMPDVLTCIVVAWIIRIPNMATLPLVAMMAILSDILLDRALGLHALMIILASEYFRAQRFDIRSQMFLLEWLYFVVIYAGITGLEVAVLSMTIVGAPDVAIAVRYVAITALAYPVIVGVLHWIFMIRSPQLEQNVTKLGRIG